MRSWIIAILTSMSLGLFAQEEKVKYEIKGLDLYCYVDRSWKESSLDSLISSLGFSPDSLAYYFGTKQPSEQEWRLMKMQQHQLTFVKPLMSLEGQAGGQKELITEVSPNLEPPIKDFRFGYNLFSKPAVISLENGLTRFFLKVEGQPRSIFLAGTFNQWSTSGLAMSPCDSGYYIDLELEAGAYYYKYIVNGRWLLDPRNRLTETDWAGNTNSVYFKENYRFDLKDFQTAEEVAITGSFCDWVPDRYFLKKGQAGWYREVYLREGTHAYKFVVDGEWMLDPGNPVVRKDDEGNENSFLALGDTFYFSYPLEANLEKVVVSGSFNEWSRNELVMQETDTAWILPYVLPPGNYSYKFIVNYNQWRLDPNNPVLTEENGAENSVLSIGANHEFFFPAQAGVERVAVSGDFNAWNPSGYSMEKRQDGWYLKVYLPQGKTRYRFIVDGEWQSDPSNPHYEPNEYGDFNSVVWKEAAY